MKRTTEVNVDTIVDGDSNVTLAHVYLELVDVTEQSEVRRESREAKGSAKRNPLDHPNLEAAQSLALGRAFLTLGNQLIKQGNGLVKHQDDVKEMKKVAAQQNARESSKSLPSIDKILGEDAEDTLLDQQKAQKVQKLFDKSTSSKRKK